MRMSVLENLAKKGNTFTVEDVLDTVDIQREVLWVILSRLEKKGWIERIEKGKYLIIPLGAEKGKYTLNEFVIGSLLINPHSIAYWSALNYYGFTEQIPGTVFIQTTSRKKKIDLEIFGVRYRIIRLKHEKFFGMRKEWIQDSEINITDKEKTLVDCLDKPQFSGGIVEVAKGLKGKDFDKKKLIRYAKRIGNSGVLRRLGYLGEILSLNLDLIPPDTRNYLLLDPTMPKKGLKSAKWKLILNLNKKMHGRILLDIK
jgi:predicted transcriptional regulator of viral defense system